MSTICHIFLIIGHTLHVRDIRTSASPSERLSIRGIRNSNQDKDSRQEGQLASLSALCSAASPLHIPEVPVRHTSTFRPWVLGPGGQQLARFCLWLLFLEFPFLLLHLLLIPAPPLWRNCRLMVFYPEDGDRPQILCS